MMLYHIIKSKEWEETHKREVYVPATFEQDGFIHLCKAEQLEGVVNRYFSGQGDLVALCIAPEALIPALRYENLIGGEELFPHLYGPLNLDSVRDVIYFSSAQNASTGSFSTGDLLSRIRN